jgi:hypothetical protein
VCRNRDVLWIADVAVAQGYAKTADGHARQTRNNGEGDALLEIKSLGHEDEFTVVCDGRFTRQDFCLRRAVTVSSP